MTDRETQGTRTGAIARARAYVEGGAFEADLARRVACRTESPQARSRPTSSSPPMVRVSGPDRPTLTLGCRGAVNFALVCDLRSGGHHSGNWGGLIANPALILANALASIVGPTGELLVPALKAPAMSQPVKEALADAEIDGGEAGPRIDAWWGSPDSRLPSGSTGPTSSTCWRSPPARPAEGADEGAFPGKKLPPHQFGQMTYGRAIEVERAGRTVHAAVSHGLTSSPPRGEGDGVP